MPDDVEIAISLARVGVDTEDSRDEAGGERFLVLSLDEERRVTREEVPSYW
jgi:hypothetical protein